MLFVYIYFLEFLWRLSQMVNIQCLKHSWCSMSIIQVLRYYKDDFFSNEIFCRCWFLVSCFPQLSMCYPKIIETHHFIAILLLRDLLCVSQTFSRVTFSSVISMRYHILDKCIWSHISGQIRYDHAYTWWNNLSINFTYNQMMIRISDYLFPCFH